MKKKKKILILGGAGFIGFYLAKELEKRYNIVLIDDLSKNQKKIDNDLKKLIKKKNINFINKDITKTNLSEFPKNFDYIFDLAAILGVKKVIKESYSALKSNLKLTIKAIEIAKNQKNLKIFKRSKTI